MTSSIEANPVVSKISLAVLESSGWYEVDYDTMAEPFLWGLNAVCAGVDEKLLIHSRDAKYWKIAQSGLFQERANQHTPKTLPRRRLLERSSAWGTTEDIPHVTLMTTSLFHSTFIGTEKACFSRSDSINRHWNSVFIGGMSSVADHCGIIGLEEGNYPDTVYCQRGENNQATGATYSQDSRY